MEYCRLLKSMIISFRALFPGLVSYARLLLSYPFKLRRLEGWGEVFIDILISFYCSKTTALVIRKMNMNILVRYMKTAKNKFNFNVYLCLYYQNTPKVSKKFLFYLK